VVFPPLEPTRAALTTVTEAIGVLAELAAMQRHGVADMDLNDVEMRRRMEDAERELAGMEAEIPAAVEQ